MIIESYDGEKIDVSNFPDVMIQKLLESGNYKITEEREAYKNESSNSCSL